MVEKKLIVPFIDKKYSDDPEAILKKMRTFESHDIACNPWPEFTTPTKASFMIAHDNESIFLKYSVIEKHLTANEIDNGNIHRDSCVEFFIAFGNEDSYYNLEFNCLGFMKIGFGQKRAQRILLSKEMIRKLSFVSKIIANKDNQQGYEWEILLIIPKEIFVYHQIPSFKGLIASGNFYKCGDGLPEPHFLSWNMVYADLPDFHRIESFGELKFA